MRLSIAIFIIHFSQFLVSGEYEGLNEYVSVCFYFQFFHFNPHFSCITLAFQGFSAILCIFRYLLIMKRPTNDDRKWSTYTAEFEVHVWVVLVLSLVAIYAALRLTSLHPSQRPLSPSDAFLVVLGGLCGQSR